METRKEKMPYVEEEKGLPTHQKETYIQTPSSPNKAKGKPSVVQSIFTPSTWTRGSDATVSTPSAASTSTSSSSSSGDTIELLTGKKNHFGKDSGSAKSQLTSNERFEIIIRIVKASMKISGLNRNAYCEAYMNGQLFDTTEVVKCPHYFDHCVYRSFPDGAFASKTVFTFVLHKQRWASAGFKIVGSVDICVRDLIPFLDTATFEKTFRLDNSSNKCGFKTPCSLTMQFQLKHMANSEDLSIHDNPSPMLGMKWPRYVQLEVDCSV